MQHGCEIHEDLMFEILTRLPAKSLMRFKCVSKKWSSFIFSQYFSNRFFTVTRQQPHNLYMYLVNEENANQSVLLSASLDSNCFVIDQDLSVPGIEGFNLNVVRGLMCFSVSEKACVFNPTTRQLLNLPAIKSDIIPEQDQKMYTWYYIGHDPVNDQYKLLCTTVTYSAAFQNIKSEHWVFVLQKQGSLWKKVVPLEDYLPHFPYMLRRSINGSVVHYMAWVNFFSCAVVSFDIRTEELTTILVPQEVRYLSNPVWLVEYGGKIALFDHNYLKAEGLVNLWILEDAGKKEWSKKTWVLQPCQRHLVLDKEFVVQGTTRDGKVILAPWEMRSQMYVLFYDMKLNDLRKIEIKGVPDRFSFDKECNVDYNFVDESESIIYLEN